MAKLINKSKIFILILFLFFSCKTAYYERASFEDYVFIKLRKKNIFEMNTVYWVMFNSFTGTWEIHKDTLILKAKNIKSKYKIIEKSKQNRDSLYFDIKLKLSNCDGMWYSLYII